MSGVLDFIKWAAATRIGFAKSSQWTTVWDTSSTKDLGDFNVTAALALTSSDTGSTPGGYTQATLIADGTHVPTVDGGALANYTNTNGARNQVALKRVGNSKYWACGAVLGLAVVIGGGPLSLDGGAPNTSYSLGPIDGGTPGGTNGSTTYDGGTP